MMREKLKGLHPRCAWAYLSAIHHTFGHKLFCMLISTYVGVKGCGHFFFEYLQLPYYREAGLTGQTQQRMFALSFLPWTCKGFIGIISDIFPLFGYQKRYYCIIFLALGSISCLALGFIPFELVRVYPIIPAILFFMIFLQTAGMDLLMEGKYVEQNMKHSPQKYNIISFVALCTFVGTIFPAATVGSISDSFHPRILFFIIFPVLIQPLAFLLRGYLIEDSVCAFKSNKIDIKKLKSESNLFIIAALQPLASLGSIFFTFFGSSMALLIYSLSTGLFLCFIGFFTLPLLTAKYNIYHFILNCLYTNLHGALEYFYAAEENCFPGGPNFNYTFLKTYAKLASSIAHVLGIILYQKLLCQLKIRTILITTTLIRIFASSFDLIIFYRWNISLGIPDYLTFLLGHAVFYHVTHTLNMLPLLSMIAKLCPPTVEATMFALLAGYGNFGFNVANISGVFMMDVFSIKTTKTDIIDCDFSNMPYMIIVGHGLLPLLTIGLSFILIPDMYLSDDLPASHKPYSLYPHLKPQTTSIDP